MPSGPTPSARSHPQCAAGGLEGEGQGRAGHRRCGHWTVMSPSGVVVSTLSCNEGVLLVIALERTGQCTGEGGDKH